MEGDVTAAMQSLQLIAHVFEEEAVLIQVHFQSTSQQA